MCHQFQQNFIMAFLMLLQLAHLAQGQVYRKLSCYQCRVEDNSLCTDDDLKQCPDDQAYDRCMTSLRRTKKDGFYIEKKCVLGPCLMRDPTQSESLGLTSCDRSKEEFDCDSCCAEDGCNKDGAEAMRYPSRNVLAGVIALWLTFYVFVFCY